MRVKIHWNRGVIGKAFESVNPQVQSCIEHASRRRASDDGMVNYMYLNCYCCWFIFSILVDDGNSRGRGDVHNLKNSRKTGYKQFLSISFVVLDLLIFLSSTILSLFLSSYLFFLPLIDLKMISGYNKFV